MKLLAVIVSLLTIVSACGRLVQPQALSLAQVQVATAGSPQNAAPSASAAAEPTLRYAGRREVQFEALSLEEGLSQSVVQDIVQDRRGFMWFGTQDGLNRFDGYTFRTYGHMPGITNSLSSDFVNALATDDDGNIWVGTNGGGLNRFDPVSETVTRYQHDPEDPRSVGSNVINGLFVDRDNVLWVATLHGGLSRYEPGSGDFTTYRCDCADEEAKRDPAAPSSNNIQAVTQDQSGAIWLATNGGLNRLDPASERFSHYLADERDPQALQSNHVHEVYVDRGGTLWVGTTDSGLYRLDDVSGKFTQFKHDPAVSTSLAYDNVCEVFQDSQGVLWVGTNGGGLEILDPEMGTFTHFTAGEEQTSAISNNQIWSIYEDSGGVLWFGTFGGGVNKYDPTRQKFALYRAEPEADNWLNNDLIWRFHEARDGRLWIATNGGGINIYDPVQESWEYLRADPQDPDSLPSDFVQLIYEDSAGNMWVGTTDMGLARLDPETGRFVSYDDYHGIMDAIEDSSGQLWVAALGGLGKYDPETDSFSYYHHDSANSTSLSDDSAVALEQGRDGSLWVGTFNGGLNRFDPETETFAHYRHDDMHPQSLINDMVITLHESADGTLWIGTIGGLDRLDPSTNRYTHYTHANGLLNDTIYAILEDDHGNIWFSTNMGLSRLDPQTDEVVHYSTRHGLQSNEFNQNAALKTSSGEMLFGGVAGFNAFHPDLVTNSSFVPPVVVTQFQLFNEPVLPGEESPLLQPVESTTALALTPEDDFFTFEFAALDFSSPEQIQYAYMLDGLDKEWNYVGTRRYAPYTNVPPGEYTFRVRATNSDGVWSETATALNVVIPPPFWQTWWFRGGAILLIIGMAAGLFAWRVRAIDQQRRHLAQEVDARTQELQETLGELERSKTAAEAANRAKSVFLANMSHEFRTPLNAILGFTQLMKRDPFLRADQSENLEVIHHSSEHLLGLINDVLELSKIEAGRMQLNPKPFDLHRMLYGLAEMFRLRAETKGLHLHLLMDEDVPQHVLMDEGKLRQVLMNLLGNAVKFTDEGQVTLAATRMPAADGQADVAVRFAVEDSGPGISAAEQEQLFEPFVQTTAGELSQEGTGLGLAISRQHVQLMGGEIAVDSEPGRGSTFSFVLPCQVVGSAAVRAQDGSQRVIGVEPGQPRFRLLIVDDQEANRRILAKTLAPLGFAVREAANGEEALAVWEAWQPHLIWMDMRMPLMDGYEATQRIKATPQGRQTVVVALTASGLTEDRSVILRSGCDDYIRKPFLDDDLYRALREHLGVRFTYESAETDASARARRTAPELVAQLAAVPADLLVQLQRATQLGDLDAIATAIEDIAIHDQALGAQLGDWAHDYEHERILDLIEQAKAGSHEPLYTTT